MVWLEKQDGSNWLFPDYCFFDSNSAFEMARVNQIELPKTHFRIPFRFDIYLK
jgi:hypothetical protein